MSTCHFQHPAGLGLGIPFPADPTAEMLLERKGLSLPRLVSSPPNPKERRRTSTPCEKSRITGPVNSTQGLPINRAGAGFFEHFQDGIFGGAGGVGLAFRAPHVMAQSTAPGLRRPDRQG